jgi:hypothetical protein
MKYQAARNAKCECLQISCDQRSIKVTQGNILHAPRICESEILKLNGDDRVMALVRAGAPGWRDRNVLVRKRCISAAGGVLKR